MDELQDKLGAILNDPNMMQQIMNLANSMGNSPQQQQTPEPSPSMPEFDFSGFSVRNRQGTTGTSQGTVALSEPGADRAAGAGHAGCENCKNRILIPWNQRDLHLVRQVISCIIAIFPNRTAAFDGVRCRTADRKR